MSCKTATHAIFAITLILHLLDHAVSDPTNGLVDGGDGKSPKIIFYSPATSSPIRYEKGLRLECHAISDTRLNWRWLRNGLDIRAGDGFVQSKANDNTDLASQTSIIELAPTDDLVATYTCVAEARQGTDRHSFTVQKPSVTKEEEERIRMDERTHLFQTYILPFLQVILLLAIGSSLISREKGVQLGQDKMGSISVGKLAKDLIEKFAGATGPAPQVDGNRDEREPSSGIELRSRQGTVKQFAKQKTIREGSSKLS